MSWTNYHSHSNYCDGKDQLEAHVESALGQLKVFGFSSHCPVPFDNTWSMKLEKLSTYLEETKALKNKYSDRIELYRGLEVDYIPELVGPSSDYIKNANLDYTIGSIHYVDQFDNTKWEIDGNHNFFLEGLEKIFDRDIQQAIERYFELTRMMIEDDCPTVVGHIDKIKIQSENGELFSEDSKWYKDAFAETLELVSKNENLIVEVNTRGIYKKKCDSAYPGEWGLKRMYELGIPVQINSDSHHPSDLTKAFSETASLLQEIGYKTVRVLKNNQWQDFKFDSTGIHF
ncbi:histidinol-phosphatase [Sediminitomix flava]|uniref:Histidinol-phosphatase n=1 Tax=Sediminitomix flava TaxID=379075 RepID=A0A315Z8E8_SEDFL|nr:histidinol-phosphatase [Sediminitomix flava]PWJ41856.1 histidinol-phosphatase (PHP family) [Sediminitomix flava]